MTAKKEKKASAAPAAAAPAEPTPENIRPFGEGESGPIGPGSEDITTEGPDIADLLPEGDELPAAAAEPKPFEFPVESIPTLIFTDAAGARYRLDPWRPQGTYLLRPALGG
jgi:hypothetical protein